MNERSGTPPGEIHFSERSNPLPKTDGVKTENLCLPTIFAESYFGYRRGLVGEGKSISS